MYWCVKLTWSLLYWLVFVVVVVLLCIFCCCFVLSTWLKLESFGKRESHLRKIQPPDWLLTKPVGKVFFISDLLESLTHWRWCHLWTGGPVLCKKGISWSSRRQWASFCHDILFRFILPSYWLEFLAPVPSMVDCDMKL